MRKAEREGVGGSGGDILEALLERYRGPLRRYGRFVALGLAVAVVALLAYRQYNTKRRGEQAESWRELAQLLPTDGLMLDPELLAQLRQSVIERCNRMLKDYWETDATPWILLKLGNTQQSAGQHEDAMATYRKLKTRFPEHYTNTLAERDLAAALEEMGRYEQAARAYEGVATQHEDGPHFWLDAGRCWELAHNRQAALGAYEQLSDSPQTVHADDLEIAAARLKHLRREASEFLAPPPEPEPSEATQVDTPIHSAEPSEATQVDTPIHSTEQPESPPAEAPSAPSPEQAAPPEGADSEPSGPGEGSQNSP